MALIVVIIQLKQYYNKNNKKIYIHVYIKAVTLRLI